MRNPNTVCVVCNTPLYRRPSQMAQTKASYCSDECRLSPKSPQGRQRLEKRECEREGCDVVFKPNRKEVRFCSRSCANVLRRGQHYEKNRPWRNSNERRYLILKDAFGFETCMVEGCVYSRCYDIHRFLPGKEGGEYIIGNMFAICPNHHAELHRKIIRFEKIDNCTLRAYELETR